MSWIHPWMSGMWEQLVARVLHPSTHVVSARAEDRSIESGGSAVVATPSTNKTISRADRYTVTKRNG